jgi:hypothetical protein
VERTIHRACSEPARLEHPVLSEKDILGSELQILNERHRGETSMNLGSWQHRGRVRLWLGLLLVLSASGYAQSSPSQSNPIRLHPENPHYFLFRGKPTVLITSGEHYGAVLNPDFDYVPYLNALQTKGFNLTRVFNGTYYEEEKSIPQIGNQNTLAPRPGRYLAPWARSTKPGFYGGGNKFDLDQWDEAYFNRLKDFVREAGKRGIVVELTLFSSTHDAQHWVPSLFQGRNNINGIGATYTNFFNSLFDPPLVKRADDLIEKTATELNAFDNLVYEICNGCYITDRSQADDWQSHLIDTLVKTEASLPSRHVIVWNYPNTSTAVVNPNPAVSVFSFQHAFPPTPVELNYRFNKAVAFDQNHQGISTVDARREAWAFILSGGALYNHLDWSFTPDDPAGSGKTVQPGGRYSGEEIRSQLTALMTFIQSFDLVRMRPNNALVEGVPQGATVYALVDPGAAYAVYVMNGREAKLSLEIGAGRYHAEWLNPRTGTIDNVQDLRHDGDRLSLASPPYQEDIALRLVRTGQ